MSESQVSILSVMEALSKVNVSSRPQASPSTEENAPSKPAVNVLTLILDLYEASCKVMKLIAKYFTCYDDILDTLKAVSGVIYDVLKPLLLSYIVPFFRALGILSYLESTFGWHFGDCDCKNEAPKEEETEKSAQKEETEKSAQKEETFQSAQKEDIPDVKFKIPPKVVVRGCVGSGTRDCNCIWCMDSHPVPPVPRVPEVCICHYCVEARKLQEMLDESVKKNNGALSDMDKNVVDMISLFYNQCKLQKKEEARLAEIKREYEERARLATEERLAEEKSRQESRSVKVTIVSADSDDEKSQPPPAERRHYKRSPQRENLLRNMGMETLIPREQRGESEHGPTLANMSGMDLAEVLLGGLSARASEKQEYDPQAENLSNMLHVMMRMAACNRDLEN